MNISESNIWTYQNKNNWNQLVPVILSTSKLVKRIFIQTHTRIYIYIYILISFNIHFGHLKSFITQKWCYL